MSFCWSFLPSWIRIQPNKINAGDTQTALNHSFSQLRVTIKSWIFLCAHWRPPWDNRRLQTPAQETHTARTGSRARNPRTDWLFTDYSELSASLNILKKLFEFSSFSEQKQWFLKKEEGSLFLKRVTPAWWAKPRISKIRSSRQPDKTIWPEIRG